MPYIVQNIALDSSRVESDRPNLHWADEVALNKFCFRFRMSIGMMSHGQLQRQFVTLGMFIIDQFSFEDEDGKPTGKTQAPEVRQSCAAFCVIPHSPLFK
jgi:hypothetical protein